MVFELFVLYRRSTPSKKSTTDVIRRDGPKWNPERLTNDIEFVMGSRANKCVHDRHALPLEHTTSPSVLIVVRSIGVLDNVTDL